MTFGKWKEEQATSAPSITPSRVRSLDGIRGVAALVVVVHHALLVIPGLASPLTALPRSERLQWALVHTPLHLVWAGTEAVYLFFVLSGFALGAARGVSAQQAWATYYPQRLLRLYLPVFGAVAVGVALILLVPRSDASGLSSWLQNRPSLTPSGIWSDATLIRHHSWLIGSLWSLRWEVVFSLTLPLFIWFARRWPSLWWLKFAASFAVMFFGALTYRSNLIFMPMFIVGVLMAFGIDRMHAIARRVDDTRRPHTSWAVLLIAALLALCGNWYLLALDAPALLLAAARPLAVAAAAVILFVGMCWTHARRLLEHRTFQWLGAISFSLYLVHEPIVVSIAFLAGPGTALVTVPISVVASFVAAVLFFRYVEQPSHRIARSVGRSLDAARRDRRPPIGPVSRSLSEDAEHPTRPRSVGAGDGHRWPSPQ